MSITLTEKLKHYVDTLSKEGWNLALREAFQGKAPSSELFEHLREECLLQSINSKEDYLIYCQNALALILLKKLFGFDLSDLSLLYLKLIRYQYPKELQLFSFYKALISFFLNNEVEDVDIHEMDYGIVFGDYGGHYPEEHLPHFIKNGELALLAVLFSLITKNESILQKALGLSRWQASFLKESSTFPEGLWIKEQEFCLASLSLINALLFEYSNVIAPCIQMQRAITATETVFKGLSPEALNSLGVLYPILHLFLLEEIMLHPSPSINVQLLQEIRQDNKYLGFGEYHAQDFHCYCSASGVGTGFACFHKGSIHVVSIGPHFASLGDMQKYGIYRTPMMKQTPFKDIKIDSSKNTFSFEGWTRVIDERSSVFKPGDTWLYMNVFVKEARAECKVKWINLQDSPELFLAFFVKAEKVIIDKNYHLHPHTLDRYQGKASEVVFQNKDFSLNIKVSAFPSIQVIPLAGERHFWGAQFLIACSLPQDQEISFEII